VLRSPPWRRRVPSQRAGYREPASDCACRYDMRSVLLAALLATSCAASQNDLGGYVNGICEPTTRRDAQTVATTTGQFGVVGSTSLRGDDIALVVWRGGGPATSLVIMAYRLDPPSACTWVRRTAGYGSAS